MLRRSIEILRKDGPRELGYRGLRYVYESGVRSRVPRLTVQYNGATVRAGRLLDPVIPGYSLQRPEYEGAIVSGIREHVSPGDSATIVGGGWGVSAVTAAERVGDSGSVSVYEGSAGGVDRVDKTARLNDVGGHITVEHAIVGADISLMGDSGGAPTITSDETADCDVLVLDCEGAELTILEEMTDRPRVVIVETHGFLGAPMSSVEDRLANAGYAVRSRAIAEPDQQEFCEENGIHVLVATLDG